jgi:hypothetical protein
MIVRLCSRLGNVMFQYAFGRALQAKTGKPVQFVWQDSREEYPLGPYNVHADFLPFVPATTRYYEEKKFNFDPDVYNQIDNICFNGCWQTEKYFVDIAAEIRQTFTLPVVSDELAKVADRLRSTNSCFIGVRRGDYLNPSLAAYHGSCGPDYYTKAIEHIRERETNVEFFVFSDDPDWCRANMPGEVISGRFSHYCDMYLMQNCRHAVLANSTYHWFGSWLGDTQPDRIVVAPKKWFGTAPLDYSDVVPERWTKIDN